MSVASRGPLQGRLILDCSALLPGPLVGKLLAARGARVLKIENPARPDPAREMPAIYADLNELKEEVALDIIGERERFHELVRQADGLIEGFRPAAKKRLGLDEAGLRPINPRLCILSLVGFEENDPRAAHAGHDLNFAALSGALSLFREMPGLPLADLFASYEGAFALTAAMDAVTRGADGARVVISMMGALERAQSSVIREYRATGHAPLPGETLFSGRYPCYQIYVAGDGRRVAVGALEAKFWAAVCQILGTPELVDRAYATGEEGARVAARVQAALGSRPWPQWAPLFAAADCCVEAVLDYAEIYVRPENR